MNLYIISKIKLKENKLENLIDYAYASSLTEAMYQIQNQMYENSNDYDLVSVREVPIGLIDVVPSDIKVFAKNDEMTTFCELPQNSNKYKIIADNFNFVPSEKIVLDLSKEEIIEEQNFASKLKENLDNQNYSEIKNMIDNKEKSFNSSFNDGMEELNTYFDKISDVVNSFLNKI
jgi:hypothetical protein